jgi:hypothetical protein
MTDLRTVLSKPFLFRITAGGAHVTQRRRERLLIHPEDVPLLQAQAARACDRNRIYKTSCRVLSDSCDFKESWLFFKPEHDFLRKAPEAIGITAAPGTNLLAWHDPGDIMLLEENQRVPRVGISLDGVLCNPVGKLGPNWKSLLSEALREEYFWAGLPGFPDEDVWVLSGLLKSCMFAAHFIADRPALPLQRHAPEAFDPDAQAAGWLHEHGFTPYHSLSTRVTDPVAWSELHELDYFITDDPDLALMLEFVGIKSYLFDRPWNQQEHPTGFENRVYSFDEAFQRMGILASGTPAQTVSLRAAQA